MTENINLFDMSNVRIFNKEIEKQKWGMFILCYVFGQLSLVVTYNLSVWLKELILFQNICSDASRVQDCWNLAKTLVRTSGVPEGKIKVRRGWAWEGGCPPPIR